MHFCCAKEKKTIENLGMTAGDFTVTDLSKMIFFFFHEKLERFDLNCDLFVCFVVVAKKSDQGY